MAIKTQVWTPDTCDGVGCQIEEIWDTDGIVPTTQGRVLRKCAAHAVLPDAGLRGVLQSENRRKNRVHKWALQNLTRMVTQKVEEDGTSHPVLTTRYTWTWTGTAPNRVLRPSFVGQTLSNPERNQLRNAIETEFGVGTVTPG
jgi:hypothetical protein